MAARPFRGSPACRPDRGAARRNAGNVRSRLRPAGRPATARDPGRHPQATARCAYRPPRARSTGCSSSAQPPYEVLSTATMDDDRTGGHQAAGALPRPGRQLGPDAAAGCPGAGGSAVRTHDGAVAGSLRTVRTQPRHRPGGAVRCRARLAGAQAPRCRIDGSADLRAAGAGRLPGMRRPGQAVVHGARHSPWRRSARREHSHRTATTAPHRSVSPVTGRPLGSTPPGRACYNSNADQPSCSGCLKENYSRRP